MSADARHVDAHLDQRELRAWAPWCPPHRRAPRSAVLAILVPTAGALPAGRGYEKVSPNDKDGQDMIGGGVKAAVERRRHDVHLSFGAFGDSEGAGLLTSFQLGPHRHRLGHELARPRRRRSSPASPARSSRTSPMTSRPRSSSTRAAIRISTAPPPAANNIYRRDADGVDAPALARPARAPARRKSSRRSPTAAAGRTTCRSAPRSINTDPVAPTVTSGPAAVAGVNNAYVSTGARRSAPGLGPAGRDGLAQRRDHRRRHVRRHAVQRRLRRRLADLLGLGRRCPERGLRPDRRHGHGPGLGLQRTNPDPNGVQPKGYWYATPDGSAAFFTSGEKLTNNSQAEPGVPDLYRYNVATDTLVDLTTADPDGAGIQGVLGASDSGGRVYFAASGALAPGRRRRRDEPLRARRRADDVHHRARPVRRRRQLERGRRLQDQPREPERRHRCCSARDASSSATTTPGTSSSTSTTSRRTSSAASRATRTATRRPPTPRSTARRPAASTCR